MTDRPTQPVVERLDAVARATGRRRSQVLRDALDAYLDAS
jgi:predicted transcriptional regulator